jgi:hypothetical protein
VDGQIISPLPSGGNLLFYFPKIGASFRDDNGRYNFYNIPQMCLAKSQHSMKKLGFYGEMQRIYYKKTGIRRRRL